jgi:hypothetical protein
MILPSRWYGPRRARVLVVSLLLAATGAGCASSGVPLPMRPGPAALPPGSPLLSRTLGEGDAWLRHYLMRSDYDAALEVLRRSSARPGDRLLRALQEGVVLHHAGRYVESNRLFEWAEQEADRRYTRSLRREVGSLIINDRVLAYSPSAGELAIIPYYRMLNYLALGSMESAVVEARKSGAYLARLDGRKQDACLGFGLVQYLAGQVYTAAGERNDALVSLRQAEHSFGACGPTRNPHLPAGFAADLLQAALTLGVQEVADGVIERYGIEPEPASADMGDLIVLLEHGFVAHRVEQDILVPILKDEIAGLEQGENASTLSAAGQITTRLAAAMLTGPEAHHLWDQSVWNLSRDGHRGKDGLIGTREVAQVLRLSWPVMRLEASRAASARLIVDGQAVDAPALEDVSARLVRDLESRRAAILMRMVARGLIKYTLSREAEEQTEKKSSEFLGRLVGFFTNTAGNLLEQADTRSWSLLPDQIAVARLRVPAGERHVKIELLDTHGAVNRIVDLGMVSVQPGGRVFLSQRVWGADPGDRDRLIRLGVESYGSGAALPTTERPTPPRLTRRRSQPTPSQPAPHDPPQQR